MSFIKSTAGIITGIGLVILILVVYTKCDDIKAWNYNRHIQKADSAVTVANVTHTEGATIRRSHTVLINSPEVKHDTTAQKVVKSSNAVIANADKEITSLRTAVTEAKAAGEKPAPRWVPYVDALYAFNIDSTVVKPQLKFRAGIDYRLPLHINAKIELEHTKQYPWTINAGVHVTFR